MQIIRRRSYEKTMKHFLNLDKSCNFAQHNKSHILASDA